MHRWIIHSKDCGLSKWSQLNLMNFLILFSLPHIISCIFYTICINKSGKKGQNCHANTWSNDKLSLTPQDAVCPHVSTVLLNYMNVFVICQIFRCQLAINMKCKLTMWLNVHFITWNTLKSCNRKFQGVSGLVLITEFVCVCVTS